MLGGFSCWTILSFLVFPLTPVWSWDKPQAAVVHSGILQSDPQPHHSAKRLCMQERSILVRRHWKNTQQCLGHTDVCSEI